MNVQKSINFALFALIIFFIASIYITWPLFFHLGDRITGFGDELVIAWIQNWVIHALFTNPLNIFNANLYYPYHNTLAFSETFILTSILAIPARILVGQPIATVNFTFISSLVLLSFSVYLLCFYLTKDFLISLLSGILIIFSPAVLDYIVHLQVLSLECVPLSILFFLHFLNSQKSRYFAISLIFLVLQVYNSIMPGYYLFISYIIIFLFYWFYNKKRTIKLINLKNLVICLISLIPLIILASPYFSVSKEFHYVRDIRDAIHLAMQPEDLLYPGITTRLQNVLLTYVPSNRFSQNFEFKPGYLGLVFSILGIIAFIYTIKMLKNKSAVLNSFFVISITGLILSFGPFLHLGRHTIHKPFPVPLPYALFYYILPGFQGFRNSGRWNMVFILGLIVVIALVLKKLSASFSQKKKIILFGLLFIAIILEYNFPIKFHPITQTKEFPPVYAWLGTTKPDSKIIELPIYNWNMEPFTSHEILREYYGTVNFRKTVNGYSGFSPPPWQELVNEINVHFPDQESIKRLKQLGINYIIIHTDEFDACSKTIICGHQRIKNSMDVLNEAWQNPSLRVIKRSKDIVVLSISSRK